MKIKLNILFLISACISSPFNMNAQCLQASNVYSFQYNGHAYEMVKENKTWEKSAACAVERGGYLTEINNLAEQDSIFYQIINNANIVFANTLNIFGTSAIWIGGSDSVAEGNWIWDGNNDGVGIQFWLGGPTGSPVNGLFSKWGTSPAEPDNSGGQNHLALTIDNRKINYGKWNDLKSTDNLFYLIEYNTLLNVSEKIRNYNIEIYPNPFLDELIIKNSDYSKIKQINITNSIGQYVKTFNNIENFQERLNVSNLNKGIYFIIIHFENGDRIKRKFIK